MSTVWKYAIAAGFIGLLPLSFLILMPLEVVMVFHLSTINKRPFSPGELSVILGILLIASSFFKFVVATIFVVLGGPIAWIAKAVLAFAFVLAFGGLVNRYYEMENCKQSGESPK